MPQAYVTRTVLDAVRSLPGYPKLRVLDLSCGQAEILSKLDAEGCDVRGTHFRPDDYILRGGDSAIDAAKIDDGVDLMQPLPYDNGSFDVVLLTEVIEHLDSYVPVIAEAGRVLQERGHLVLSTPNIQRVHSRFRFFLTGTHKLIDRGPRWDLAPDQIYRIHSNMADFPLLHMLLFQAGLRVQSLHVSRFKLRHSYWVLLYPFFALTARVRFRARKGNKIRREGERDLRRWMSNPAMLFSEQLVMVATRCTGG